MEAKIGNKVRGKIVKITNYGAFVEIEGDSKWGLIHISKIAKGYVKRVEDHVKQGEEIEATIIGVDQNGKLSLSLIEKDEEKKEKIRNEEKPKVQSKGVNFEDKLDQFLKDSEDKISKIRNARIRKTRGKR